jgi:hypothetical protein
MRRDHFDGCQFGSPTVASSLAKRSLIICFSARPDVEAAWVIRASSISVSSLLPSRLASSAASASLISFMLFWRRRSVSARACRVLAARFP